MSDSLWLSPKEFAESYHWLPINDYRLGIGTHIEITNYIAGSALTSRAVRESRRRTP